MEYSIKATSSSNYNGTINKRQTKISFATTEESEETLANPAELFLGSFAACILKNVERFSKFQKFEYTNAEIKVNATRLEKPPRIDKVIYELIIYSKDNSLNTELLKRNIEKFGTIFNTIKSSCLVEGKIIVISK